MKIKTTKKKRKKPGISPIQSVSKKLLFFSEIIPNAKNKK
jgi:hypothetical protein